MEQMLKMLRRMWQQIFLLWRRFAERWSKAEKVRFHHHKVQQKRGMAKPLSAAEYEFLFVQLLEGVHRGWSQAQVLRYIEGLDRAGLNQIASSTIADIGENRTRVEGWVEWLRRFGERLLSSRIPNQELATRMVQLRKLNCGLLGEVAGEIGQQLLDREEIRESTREPLILQIEGSHEGNVETALQIGYEQLDRRQYPSALMSFQQAAHLQPNSPQVLYALGLACHRLGLYHEEIRYLSQALEVNPTNAEVLTQRGLAYKAMQLTQEARTDFDRVMEIKPQSPADWRARGKALVQLHRHAEALAAYERAIEENPGDCHAWYDLGNALYDLQRYEEAISTYDQALQIEPEYAPGWFNKGAALGNLHRYAEAIAAFDRVLDIQPHDYHAWLCRGQTLEHLEQYREAIAAYEVALKVRPDDPITWRYHNEALNKLKKT